MKKIILICASLILTGCGARGPLYLPQKTDSTQQSKDSQNRLSPTFVGNR
ncbi:LPS translocon maturation chaperone LptM [Coxiella-like endosymbiont]|nr:lipoprotein [Coxiella-like endosymbiont]